ncbi:Uncharacterised protein [Vibrio cholerae]|nr:Uncharacterised protein [Vibrio cholerae]
MSRLTTTIDRVERIIPGTISYTSNQPPDSCFQTTIVTPPTMIPDSAP